jgi:hypothetical protein
VVYLEMMNGRHWPLVAAVLFTAFSLTSRPFAHADTFGTSGNEFTIDFVNIGNAGIAADTTGYGAVPYEYRMGKYEISQDAIDKATASGMANVTAGAWTNNRPAADIYWYEAAAFVNWLNTSTGRTAAYNLTFSPAGPGLNDIWSMQLWSSEQAWTAGGTNLYRNKDAYYFLPSENEWYKAAYYNPAGSNYFLYPTDSDEAPVAVASGTNAGTAVIDQLFVNEIAAVDDAGGLSSYGTMGQGGNVWEWTESAFDESAFDDTNSASSAFRAIRGGASYNSEEGLRSSSRGSIDPTIWDSHIGFRVASVPEPSTYALVLLGAGAMYVWRRRKGSDKS